MFYLVAIIFAVCIFLLFRYLIESEKRLNERRKKKFDELMSELNQISELMDYKEKKMNRHKSTYRNRKVGRFEL